MSVPVETCAAAHCEPLSFSEMLMWFNERAWSTSVPFLDCPTNLTTALRLTNRLDVRALRRAVDALVERHVVLSSRFPERDGRPVRAIGVAPSTLEVDLRAVPPARRPALVDALLAAYAGHSFDLAAGPVFRVLLLTLDEELHVLALTA